MKSLTGGNFLYIQASGVHLKLSLLFFALLYSIVMLIPIAIGRSISSIAERDARLDGQSDRLRASA